MINYKRIIYILLSRNIVYCCYTKALSKKTKMSFFISKKRAEKNFEKITNNWKNWCSQNKTFLRPVMLFSGFYTLTYPVIEYKINFDQSLEMYYLTLWVNKKNLFYMLVEEQKLNKKIKEIEDHSKKNNIKFQPFFVKEVSESSESL